jgi:HlyD family secretion protein
VEEVRVARGDFVSPGTVIATMTHVSSHGFEVVAVFSHDMSKRITPSMDAQVRPVSVKKEEYGSMRGRVSSITEHSISKVEVDVILRNPELTSKLMADSAPLLAKIEVFVDDNTPSGFAWWGGQGPPFSVTRGTRVAVDVVVERTPPIALIIPAFRKLLGIEG